MRHGGPVLLDPRRHRRLRSTGRCTAAPPPALQLLLRPWHWLRA